MSLASKGGGKEEGREVVWLRRGGISGFSRNNYDILPDFLRMCRHNKSLLLHTIPV